MGAGGGREAAAWGPAGCGALPPSFPLPSTPSSVPQALPPTLSWRFRAARRTPLAPHTHPGPHSPSCGPKFFQAAPPRPSGPHPHPRYSTSHCSRFSGQVGLRGRNLVGGKGSSGSEFFCQWISLLSCPKEPLQISSQHLPFHLGHPGSVKFWGDLKRSPSGHSSRWPPGVRLCPAGRKVLASFHPISQALESRASWGRPWR